jgi:hypothetical protein
MSFLEKNCHAIETRNRILAEKLRSYAGGEVQLERARSGLFTFKYDGRLFHSSYDPAKEASTQVEEIVVKKPDWVVLFGFGCGHMLEELISKDYKKVIIYDPSIEILHAVLSEIDLSKALSIDTVYLSNDMLIASRFISDYVEGIENMLSYQPGPYRVAFPKEYLDFTNKVQNAHVVAQVAVVTNVDSRLPWIDNYLENCESFVKYPPIDVLKGRLEGLPLIVVGAGPSLAKNAHLLKGIMDKVIVVAAITAYKPLLKFGVIPHFVIAGERVDLPEYFTGGDSDKEIRLVLSDISHPNIFKMDVKSKFVFYNAFSNLSLEQAGFWGSDYFASIGGSVTTAALDIGLMFGCDPIVFIGQNLSFSNGQTHVQGGVYIDQELTFDEEKCSVKVEQHYNEDDDPDFLHVDSHRLLWLKGCDGKPVPSKFDWVTFHQWFETYMAYMVKEGMEQKVINATEGGAFIEGMEHTTLADVIERYATKEIELDSIVDAAVRERKAADLPCAINSLVQMRDGLIYIKRQAGQIVKEVLKMKASFLVSGLTLALQENNSRIVKKEKALFDKTAKVPFLWEALSSYTHELKEHLRDDRPESQKEQFKTEIKVIEKTYREVGGMAKRLLPLFDETLRKLESMEKL